MMAGEGRATKLAESGGDCVAGGTEDESCSLEEAKESGGDSSEPDG
jgi:hypothetical protein